MTERSNDDFKYPYKANQKDFDRFSEMAGYIKGITIEFGADTSKLNGALKKTQGTINKTQAELKQINRALKFNPGNTTLLKQKFELLQRSVTETRTKLKQLQDMQRNMQAAGVDRASAQYRELEREIIKTENQLKRAEGELRRFGSVGKQQALAVGAAFKSAGTKIASAGRTITTTVSVWGVAGIYAGSKLIEMSEKQAQAEQKLTEIYKTRMGATDGAAKSTMKLASALQQQGVVGDEVALSFAQQMATYSSAPGTVNALLPAFENLLVQQKGLNGTQEDAVGLANMFGKALMGQTGALKRAGISFTDAQAEVLKYGTEEEKAAMMAEVITQNVGNMNKEFAKTDAGKIQQAKNQLGDMGEEIGAVLLPAVADLVKWFQKNLMPVMKKVIKYFKQHPAIAKLALAFAAITAALGPVLMMFGGLIKVIGSVISIVRIAGSVFTFLCSPIGLVVAAIAAAIAIGVLLYKNWDTIKKKASQIWTAIKTAITTVVNAIVTNIKNKFNAIKTTITTIFTAIKTAITTRFTAIKTSISNIVNGIKTTVTNVFNAVKSKVSSIFGGVKDAITDKFNAAKDKVASIVGGIKDKISNGFSGIKDKVSSAFSGVKDKITKPFNDAKDKVNGIINKIKGFFPVKIGKLLKNIKLPHFSLSWNSKDFGKLGTIKYPTGFSVSWSKKAMQQQYLFNNATLFGAGERGDEMLYGRSALMKDIASAVNGGGDMIVNVYGSDNMSVNELAASVEQRLITMQKRRTQAWA